MVRTVGKSCFKVNNGIACKNTVCNSILKSFFNCGEEVLRNGAAEYALCKFKLLLFAGLELDLNVTVLTVTAGLLLMLSFNLDLLADGLSVRNFGIGKFHGCTELCLKLGHDNVKVHITETGNNELLCFSVVFKLECRIFFHELAKTACYFFFIALCLRNNCKRKARSGEIEG